MKKMIACVYIFVGLVFPMNRAQEAAEPITTQSTVPTLQPSTISFLPGLSAENAATILQKASALIEREEKIGKTDTQILMECANAIVSNGHNRTNVWDVLKWTIIMVPASIISTLVVMALLHEKFPGALDNIKAGFAEQPFKK